jgi:tetratricopeptide (TPR) repeat protein
VGPASIRGIVVTPGGAPLSEAVKVTLKVLRGDQAVIYTDQQGRFEFGGLGPGGYTIEVDPDRDARFEITTEVISVLRNTPTFVTITIKEKQRENRSTGDKTISVAMLDQKVPSEAKREFDKATRLDSQGRTDESVNALRRALAIYPDYLMALNDLGARLLDLGQLTEAAQHLRAAIKIDPNAFNPQLNLGVVLVRQNEFGQALEILGKALSLEPSAPAAHLYAGMAAAGLNDSGRAEKELNSAYELGGHPYAVALIYLARLYTKKGDREQAIKSLEAYLRDSPNDPNSAEVKKMIAALH